MSCTYRVRRGLTFGGCLDVACGGVFPTAYRFGCAGDSRIGVDLGTRYDDIP
jgi:hypothetical protein